MLVREGRVRRGVRQLISAGEALWLESRLEMPEGTEPPSVEEVRRRRAEWQAAHPGQRLPSRSTQSRDEVRRRRHLSLTGAW